MPNASRKCPYCNAFNRVEDAVYDKSRNRYFCNETERQAYARNGSLKAQERKALKMIEKIKRVRRQERRNAVIRDLKWWKDKAQRSFNAYIRERDKNKPCISCGVTNYRITAGHYKTVGAHPELRFHPMNAHGQCWWNCNRNKSGNVVNARPEIVNRYGQAVMDFLESSHQGKKYTINDCKIVDKWFKRKLKRLRDAVE